MPGTSQARPGDPLVPGQERRASPDDPEPGVGRHTRGNDGEGEVKQGEESQAGRRRAGRDWPDDPEPGEGRHLRGDGEGERSRGEERRRGARRASPDDPEPGVGRHTRGNDKALIKCV